MINFFKERKLQHENRSFKNYLVYDILEKFFISRIGLYKGTLYDLGCGSQPYKKFFLQYVENYIGVDWPESSHNIGECIEADLNKSIPIGSEVADCVISISVLEHLYQPQIMINESYRILKRDCHLILQVPWQWWVHEAPHDYYRYTPYALEYMLKEAGFRDIVIEAQCGFFTTLVLKLNYFSARFIRGHRLTRKLVKSCLLPFWYMGQTIAPLLDKFDRDWKAEAGGYFVTAKK